MMPRSVESMASNTWISTARQSLSIRQSSRPLPTSSASVASTWYESPMPGSSPWRTSPPASDAPRESVRLLITGARGPGGFPPPITDPRSRYRLWRWSDVALWLTRNLGVELSGANDEILAAFNAGLELRHHRRRLARSDYAQAGRPGRAVRQVTRFRHRVRPPISRFGYPLHRPSWNSCSPRAARHPTSRWMGGASMTSRQTRFASLRVFRRPLRQCVFVSLGPICVCVYSALVQ